MSIATYSKFNQYKKLIQSLPANFTDETIRGEEFLLEKDAKKKLEIYYAPFEYVNEHAKVAIIGITPGLHQMKKSYSTVLNAKDQLEDDEEILHQVKKNSSFEGPMRKNLVQMLDELGLHEYLGISSTIKLFNEASQFVYTSSVIPYPVFYNGKNYSGSTPNMLKTEILKKYVIECFASEIIKLHNPLIIPLGVNVTNVFDYLIENKLIKPESILLGFPHTSGANGHRFKQFEENKEQMKEIIRVHFKNQPIL